MVPFGIQTANSFIPATTLAQGIPPIATPDLDNGVLDIPLNVGFEGMPKNLHRGYIQSANFTIQQEIGKGFAAQAGYVATRSVRQLGYVDINASQIPFTNRDTQPLFQSGDAPQRLHLYSRWVQAHTIRCRRPSSAGSAMA